MTEKQVRLGFDRFMALDWANYALEQSISECEQQENYEKLKSYLQREIPGIDSSRKTANQLKRLWLNDQDEYQGLREGVAEILNHTPESIHPVFHLGMAMNVFPIFNETCIRIGELSGVQGVFENKSLINRVSSHFLNPSSIPRIVTRVVQTLVDWKFLETSKGIIRLHEVIINQKETCNWFIQALLISNTRREVTLRALVIMLENLGVRIPDIRRHIQQSQGFVVHRNAFGDESISLNTTTDF